MRVLGSPLRVTGGASLVGIRMNAGYSEKFETTNEFSDQVLRNHTYLCFSNSQQHDYRSR